MKQLHLSKGILFCAIGIFVIVFSCRNSSEGTKIDRFALVNRHSIVQTKIDSLGSLSVGNGKFAFTADITGLQSFPEYYETGIPLGTQTEWNWHSFPDPEHYSLNDVYKKYKVGSDPIPYIYQFTQSRSKRKNEASQWLRENPHRLNLALIGLDITKTDPTPFEISDIQNPVQELDLWKGELTSHFEIEGRPVDVTTICHPTMDMIAVKIKSPLIASGKLRVKMRFPYPSHNQIGPAYNLNSTSPYTTEIVANTNRSVTFKNQIDSTTYFSQVDWQTKVQLEKKDAHSYFIVPDTNSTNFEFECLFSKKQNTTVIPGFSDTEKQNEESWASFWNSGGAVDFSACTDPRAFELERRVVLSQYLTRIQSCGSLPPQETGLTYNSWYGKFHLEMHWWHSMHFIFWNRPELMESQLDYYNHIYNRAMQTAKVQGYKGVRWPKMTGPDGRESPSTIGTFLIWQEPHIIYFAEMLNQYYLNDANIVGSYECLIKYKDLVFATADFMASYARWDSTKQKYVLGPALIPAQERFDPETTINPTFELAYWYRGLKTAQAWRQELGLKADTTWQYVIDNLSDLPVKDSLYLFTENAPDSYTNPRYLTDHPMVLGALGFLPETKKVDKKIMGKTLDAILEKWDWQSLWGWDFPLMAMDATCLDRPELAVDLLLKDSPKNTYLTNGHNYQSNRLTIYLPGNGGLLSAVAMMCTYRNKDGKNGFPDNGKWEAKYENLVYCANIKP